MLSLNNNAPRRVGMTRKGYEFQGSLLETGPKLQSKPTASATSDILAPPEDSSDEASRALEKADLSSDDSQNGRSKGKRQSPTFQMPGKSLGLTSPKEEGPNRKHEPPTEPLKGVAPSFVSDRTSRSRGGSQSSQKRKYDPRDEDQEDIFGSSMGMACSQPKKTKTSYGHNAVNIHTAASSQEKKITRSGSQGSQRKKGEFRMPNTKAILAEVDKYESLEVESGRITLKRLPFNKGSPRSQKNSQCSNRSSREPSQGSQKPSFKPPPKLSPAKRKAGSTPKAILGLSEKVNGGRTTRSSASSKELQPMDNSNTTQLAAKTAADKLGIQLGILTSHSKSPPSSIDRLSAESTPLEGWATGSSLTSTSDEPVPTITSQEAYCITSEDIPVFNKKERPSICPSCKEPVDKTFLEARIGAGKRLTIRQQAQFCSDHKISAARDEWRVLGYPTIDWTNFNDQLNQYHLALDDILQKRRTSFYRNAFEDLVKSGKNWTWQQDVMSGNRIEELSPGYYGGRGAKLMMENIMLRFAGKIRRLASSDSLISTGGVSGFVQAVLVPELAVMLVQADMNIDDEEKAREILRNSVEIGHMLNEEEDELIQDPDLQDG